MSPKPHWIVTADARHARMFELTKAPGAGGWHAQERRAIHSSHEDEHEHHRPSALGRGPVASEAQHFASWGHEAEEQRKRFARETAEWLSATLRHLRAEHVHVFAASQALGLLREEIRRLDDRAHLEPRLTLHESELTRLEASELATHPAIVASLRVPENEGQVPP